MAAHGAVQGEHKEGLSNGMLGFILFVASEVMFFGGLFAAYFIARADSPEWPPHTLLEELKAAGEIGANVEFHLHMTLPVIATAILILSSVTIQYSVYKIQKGNRTGMIWWMFVSLTLAVIFLIMQMYDYMQLEFRAGDTIYGTTFYTLTGFHGAHVAGGAIFMLVVLLRGLAGQFSAKNHEAVEACSMYWHFVDVVWIALFVTIYIFGR